MEQIARIGRPAVAPIQQAGLAQWANSDHVSRSLENRDEVASAETD
jgi:hypothetical protein